MPEPITLDELDAMADIVRTQGMDPSGAWRPYHGRMLALPSWFDTSLAADSVEYRHQQFRLWRSICGIDAQYDPARDEQAPEIGGFDPIRSPGFYVRRDNAAIASAGDHVIALGHLLKHCKLHAGDWALEYGAGFGQIALTLARLGVNVDAVDINPMFNDAVRAQAGHYKVPLHAVAGEFGHHPRPGLHYDLILFYEAFHHCADAEVLVSKLRTMVKPSGQILMAGEPIVIDNPSVPYPWGVRLDAETVAVMRWRHWLELGYQEDYLARLFIRNGFIWSKHACEISHYGEIYAFQPRPARIQISDYKMPFPEEQGWHGKEPTGRWTAGSATILIDGSGRHTHICLSLSNFHSHCVECQLTLGETSLMVKFDAAESLSVTLPCPVGALQIAIGVTPVRLTTSEDNRALGIFVHWFEYVVASKTTSFGWAQPEVTKLVKLAGCEVSITGDPLDPYFNEVAAHAADMTNLVQCMATVPNEAVILDVGANIGLSAIAMAIARPGAHVIAFEPNPATYDYLCRNVAAFKSIEPVQVAVSHQAGVLQFHPSAYAAGSHVVGSAHIQSDMKTVEVGAMALDDFISERNISPDFIKIDVEGHEPEAIAGAAALIERCNPTIYMEFNSWTLNAFAGHSPSAFARALWESFDIEDQPNALRFLYENLIQKGCVSNITMRLKSDARVPSLDVMSFSQTALDRISRT